MVTKPERELDGIAKRLSNLTPGNPQATGRTPNYLRQEHQEAHGELVSLMLDCIRTGKEVPRWIVQALEVTGKYGMGAVGDVTLANPDVMIKVASVLAEYAEAYKRPTAEVQDLYERIAARLADV